jgi:selenide,water dikinase
MDVNTPVIKDLVLVGGGHSHLAVLKKFGMRPVEGVRATLVTREVHAPYSGMLPGYLAGHYEYDEAHIDLRPLCEFAGARLFRATVSGLDLERKRIECKGRPDVSYDVMSINVGSVPTAEAPGAREHAMPVKPVQAFLEQWERIVQRVVDPDSDGLRVAVVGAGAGGVELLLSVRHRVRGMLSERSLDPDRVEFVLVSAGDRPLETFNPRTSRKFERIFDERGIETHMNSRVERVSDGLLHCASVDDIAFDELIWVTTPSAPAWISETGLDTTEDGFIAVDASLQSTSHEDVFAAGDVATMLEHPRPKSGVFAVRAGPPLADNLRRRLERRALRGFRPQSEFLSLIGTGDEYAVGSRGIFSFEGEWVWTLKQWIDTRWMDKWRDLPEMQAEQQSRAVRVADSEALEHISTAAMRCGGCGAKVGATVLSRVLERLDAADRDNVVVGLDSPDDCAVIRVPDGMVAVKSVDFFRAFVEDPYVFGRIAANHALGDVWAMGAAPQSALAIATIPYGLEDKVEETLYQLLAGAMSLLDECNAALVGGHSGEGEELAFGLEVTGVAREEALLRKGGMQPGDTLILTKPVGTGTLFAANMRREAKGRWIESALDVMAQPSAAAARVLFEHGATACTDVTGFGIIGHLVEMVEASGVDATVDLDAIPVLDGALDTLQKGITSSLQPENLRLRRAIRNVEEAGTSARYPLLFDPQTAGGLLASVPAERAVECVEALHEAGYGRAAVIGEVEARGDAEAIHIRS